MLYKVAIRAICFSACGVDAIWSTERSFAAWVACDRNVIPNRRIGLVGE